MPTKKTMARRKRSGSRKADGGRPVTPPAKGRMGLATATAAGSAPAAGTTSGMRVRMYRIGFGDFFLVTVPSAGGPKHILIDCGVHGKDVHSIDAAVSHMAQETGKHLSLIIVTHRHADHVTGFSKCKDVFKQFTVDRIWMSWYENPADKGAVALQANIAAVALQLRHALAARNDKTSQQYVNMVSNIVDGFGVSGGNQNPGAFEVLRSFPGNPPIDYYKAGDVPTLPPDLVAAGVSVQILGPPDDRDMISKTSKKSQEYIAARAGSGGGGSVKSFPAAFRVQPDEYQSSVFELLPRKLIESRVASVQPDLLAAQAAMANSMINNQSLVTLFTFKGKTLLFAGDAQWGNWANFLFGSMTSTKLKPESADLLGKLDFYKVGHHGSTNATPKDALAAMRDGCVAMCSTAIGAYNEVPRDALMTAIDQRTQNQLARSDQVDAGDSAADKSAGTLPAKTFKANTVMVGKVKCGYIDYTV